MARRNVDVTDRAQAEKAFFAFMSDNQPCNAIDFALAFSEQQTAELRAENERLRKELTQPRPPLFGKHRCPACGEMTRDTTAGCDHCDLEDK